jgi:hypothetical protein
MNIQYVEWEVIDWIAVAVDRYRWQAFVNQVMDLGVA